MEKVSLMFKIEQTTNSQKSKKNNKFYWKHNLEDMEGFKLDIAAALLEKVHHCLQVLGLTDVPRHDCEVVTFQQQLTKQLHTTAQNTCTSAF